MARSVNKVILVGRLGKDAETKFTPSGAAVTNFTMATNRRWKDAQTNEWKEETDWHNIVMWRGENVATYLTKGKQIYVEGRLQTRNYENKEGRKVYITEVVISPEDLMLLGGQGGGESAAGGGEYSQQPVSMPRSARPPAAAPAAASSAPPDDEGQGVSDDDVPF